MIHMLCIRENVLKDRAICVFCLAKNVFMGNECVVVVREMGD